MRLKMNFNQVTFPIILTLVTDVNHQNFDCSNPIPVFIGIMFSVCFGINELIDKILYRSAIIFNRVPINDLLLSNFDMDPPSGLFLTRRRVNVDGI